MRVMEDTRVDRFEAGDECGPHEAKSPVPGTDSSERHAKQTWWDSSPFSEYGYDSMRFVIGWSLSSIS